MKRIIGFILFFFLFQSDAVAFPEKEEIQYYWSGIYQMFQHQYPSPESYFAARANFDEEVNTLTNLQTIHLPLALVWGFVDMNDYDYQKIYQNAYQRLLGYTSITKEEFDKLLSKNTNAKFLLGEFTEQEAIAWRKQNNSPLKIIFGRFGRSQFFKSFVIGTAVSITSIALSMSKADLVRTQYIREMDDFFTKRKQLTVEQIIEENVETTYKNPYQFIMLRGIYAGIYGKIGTIGGVQRPIPRSHYMNTIQYAVDKALNRNFAAVQAIDQLIALARSRKNT